MKIKKLSIILLPFLAVALSSLLILTSADEKMQDVFQRGLKPTKEDDSVLMVAIDDTAINNIGFWPLTRDSYTKCLVTMRELGAESAVFDLSFVDKSQAKLDEDKVNYELPQIIEESFAELEQGYFTSDVVKNNILANLATLNQPYDRVFGQGLSYFGNSYLNFNFDYTSELSEEEISQMESKLSIKNISVKKDTKTPEYSGALYVLPEFVNAAANAGFCNADTDRDGYLRRIYPVLKFDGKYYGQMALVPLLNRFGNPDIEITNSYFLLKNAKIDENTTKDIKIPRGENGSIILKYPKKTFTKYNAISFWNIYRISLLEEAVYETMDPLAKDGIFSLWDGMDPFDQYVAIKYMQEVLQESGEVIDEENPETSITFDLYFSQKEAFFENLAAYIESDPMVLIADALEDDEESIEYYKSLMDSLIVLSRDLIKSRTNLKNKLNGAMCIFGTSATSTSDYSVNQYEDKYPSPGAHYTFANQILSEDFVDDSPFYVSILIAIVLCYIYSLLSGKIKGTTRQIVFGLCLIAGSSLLLFAYYLLFRTFVGFIVPVVSLSLDFVITIILGFLTASKDKKFITNAFGQCLSKEVVAEIIANPSSFKLGGQKLTMTAIFTDIQKFSSFSELLTAAQLVALLNYYLTEMSDIIMEERGTVDKYEGDAIIALVGAPVQMDEHAIRAVSAALKMKEAEARMNKEIVEIAASEKPADMDEELYSAFKIMVENKKSLFTRIGINSGEMIAGYMGSENKKNYTMMGNNVNLASRLEGVNKQYSTGGILISEATYTMLGDEFIVRRLDRVRVVNVNTPIRLYEPLARKAGADEKLVKYAEAWEKVMDVFEAKQYDKAYEGFKKLSEYKPSDNVAKYYISLLEKFFLQGKAPEEKDDFGVEYNAEDGVFRLLQK